MTLADTTIGQDQAHVMLHHKSHIISMSTMQGKAQKHFQAKNTKFITESKVDRGCLVCDRPCCYCIKSTCFQASSYTDLLVSQVHHAFCTVSVLLALPVCKDPTYASFDSVHNMPFVIVCAHLLQLTCNSPTLRRSMPPSREALFRGSHVPPA